MITIEDYRQVAPPGIVDIIRRLGEMVRGRALLHITGGRLGGGPAETLRAAVPVLSELGVETRWEVTGGDPMYYGTVRALQAALEGAERVLSDEALEHYLEMSRVTAKKLTLDADLVLVHDVQPAGLIEARGQGHWLWRCHFDCSSPQRTAWSFFRPLAAHFDGAVFSLPGFASRLGIPEYVVAPSIDPLSEKNREMPPHEVARILASLGVGQDKPLLVQIGPFTRGQDPLGVVNAYRLVKRHHDVRLALAGTADDESEGATVLTELRAAAQQDRDIVVLELPAEAHRQINALQRGATIVLQKSLRETFGLGAAEAMWKGKPVIGGYAGGLSQQIVHDATGYIVHSVEGAAFRIRHLLNNREFIPRLGAAGREHVRRAFLITRHLVDYLALMARLTA